MLGVAAVLLAVIVWRWIGNWGLVTVHKNDAPIAEVIKSIERQGGITIVTNADPTVPVTLHVDKVAPAAALDELADWMDANWSVTYVTGADGATVKNEIANLSSGQRSEGVRMFRSRGGGGFMMDMGEVTVDPRKIKWTVTPSDSGELQSYLEQFAAKTGAAAMVPETWNPTVSGTPKGGKASSAVRKLVKSVGGEVEEIFNLRVSDWGGDGGPRTASNGGPPDRGGWDGGRGRTNPEWAEERVQAQLAQLPAADRERVQTEMNEMRAFWDRVRQLPEDQRRAEMEKMFNDPTVQDRMVEREARREGRRSPEGRAERYRRYIERKLEMKNQSS